MNWFWIVLSVSLTAAVVVLGWRYAAVKRALRDYSATIHAIAEGEKPISELPEDVARLEDLSYAVKTLALTLRIRTSVVDTERARLATVLDQMTDGVLIVDVAGRVQFANPAIDRLFETKDVIGRTVVEVLRQHQQ